MTDTNTAEREAVARAIWALMREHEDRCDEELEDLSRCHPVWEYADAARASLAASAGSPEINGQLYTALNNLFTHLGMEGCITADHAFVWDAMTALKRIDGGVHLDNLAVPVDPDAHRDDMLAAVQLLEGGEWAEHFAKTPIGMRLEDQITKLHNEVAANAGSEPVADGGSFLLLPTRPAPDAPANTAGLDWDAYSGAQMLAYGRSCSDAALAAVQTPPSLGAEGCDPWGACVGGRVWVGRLPAHVPKMGLPIQWLYTHYSPPEGMAGWKLVPIEPTLDMGWAYLDAARESEPLRTHSFNHAGYRAMIAATPPIPASEAKEL
ncbi:hypothetical protein [Acidovorax sp. SD340]|uniref:hypothetical protein n=1 Tax=Acidovorax sp. SD340 TaxID=1690268 RepID=UPI0006DBFA3F|nr:hypothetical protein [Acidovorax sp. SD340]KQB59323.1 hypothetical protein AE621_10365 [Acidovorax sp. SD340]MBO1007148.1 hypothetical protein [Acidovorax sp. SD340]